MPKYMARDTFARTELVRFARNNGSGHTDCAWCGQKPKMLYTYVVEHDGGPCVREPRNPRWFCRLDCYQAYSY